MVYLTVVFNVFLSKRRSGGLCVRNFRIRYFLGRTDPVRIRNNFLDADLDRIRSFLHTKIINFILKSSQILC
jgi:hypothetical protein